MDKPQWKDETSYYRNDKDRTPRTCVIQCAALAVTVTRSIYHSPDQWLLICNLPGESFIGFGGLCSYVELQAKDIEDAKREAVQKVREQLGRLLGYAQELPT